MIIKGDEVEPTPDVEITEEADHLAVSFEPDHNFAPALLLHGDLLPEAFRMQMGSVVPYFLESILDEAGVDYAYEDIACELLDQDYSASIGFYLRREDLPEFFDVVRNSGAATIYDFVFQLEDQEIVLTHDDRLLFSGYDREELGEAVDLFTEELDAMESSEKEEPAVSGELAHGRERAAGDDHAGEDEEEAEDAGATGPEGTVDTAETDDAGATDVDQDRE